MMGPALRGPFSFAPDGPYSDCNSATSRNAFCRKNGKLPDKVFLFAARVARSNAISVLPSSACTAADQYNTIGFNWLACAKCATADSFSSFDIARKPESS